MEVSQSIDFSHNRLSQKRISPGDPKETNNAEISRDQTLPGQFEYILT